MSKYCRKKFGNSAGYADAAAQCAYAHVQLMTGLDFAWAPQSSVVYRRR